MILFTRGPWNLENLDFVLCSLFFALCEIICFQKTNFLKNIFLGQLIWTMKLSIKNGIKKKFYIKKYLFALIFIMNLNVCLLNVLKSHTPGREQQIKS